MSTPFNPDWLNPGAAVEVSIDTIAAYHSELLRIRAALAESVQEPVAKVELMTAGGNAGLATRIVEIDDHLRERLRPGQLLYTTPPQRKPLRTVTYVCPVCAASLERQE